MNFFIDNNLPPALAKALAELSLPEQHIVMHLRQKFSENIADVDFIHALSKEGNWAIVTQDRLVKKSVEREALRRSGIPTYILKPQWMNAQYWDKAAALVRWWPIIVNHALRQRDGAFDVPFNLSGRGKFTSIKL